MANHVDDNVDTASDKRPSEDTPAEHDPPAENTSSKKKKDKRPAPKGSGHAPTPSHTAGDGNGDPAKSDSVLPLNKRAEYLSDRKDREGETDEERSSSESTLSGNNENFPQDDEVSLGHHSSSFEGERPKSEKRRDHSPRRSPSLRRSPSPRRKRSKKSSKKKRKRSPSSSSSSSSDDSATERKKAKKRMKSFLLAKPRYDFFNRREENAWKAGKSRASSFNTFAREERKDLDFKDSILDNYPTPSDLQDVHKLDKQVKAWMGSRNAIVVTKDDERVRNMTKIRDSLGPLYKAWSNSKKNPDVSESCHFTAMLVGRSSFAVLKQRRLSILTTVFISTFTLIDHSLRSPSPSPSTNVAITG